MSLPCAIGMVGHIVGLHFYFNWQIWFHVILKKNDALSQPNLKFYTEYISSPINSELLIRPRLFFLCTVGILRQIVNINSWCNWQIIFYVICKKSDAISSRIQKIDNELLNYKLCSKWFFRCSREMPNDCINFLLYLIFFWHLLKTKISVLQL